MSSSSCPGSARLRVRTIALHYAACPPKVRADRLPVREESVHLTAQSRQRDRQQRHPTAPANARSTGAEMGAQLANQLDQRVTESLDLTVPRGICSASAIS